MKQLNIPFSLFDFFAILMPGIVSMMGVLILVKSPSTIKECEEIISRISTNKMENEFILFFVLILFSYLMGHILNALSELLIDKQLNKIKVKKKDSIWFGYHLKKDMKTENVKTAIVETFGEKVSNEEQHREIFNMVETLMMKYHPEKIAEAKSFIAIAVMFESLALSSLFIGGVFVFGSIPFKAPQIILIILLTLVLAGLFIWSYRRYKSMWSKAVLFGFAAWFKNKRSEKL
jgi:hypothetical protein